MPFMNVRYRLAHRVSVRNKQAFFYHARVWELWHLYNKLLAAFVAPSNANTGALSRTRSYDFITARDRGE